MMMMHVTFQAILIYLLAYFIGMGALLIRNKHLDILNKLYWGGGTVSIASDKDHFCVFHVGIGKHMHDSAESFTCRDVLAVGMKMERSTSSVLLACAMDSTFWRRLELITSTLTFIA